MAGADLRFELGRGAAGPAYCDPEFYRAAVELLADVIEPCVLEVFIDATIAIGAHDRRLAKAMGELLHAELRRRAPERVEQLLRGLLSGAKGHEDDGRRSH
ncbi:hypothetical protein [Nannocystis sp. SCPEA4]|uniref:hypothetical protein n=1 Tax=Nannocystis sp. SCPEA4 TaxID=2996787 RepID=UPI00227015FD|nr:hypothetical protein [Nannocystis sp. SCPEA4]MCY1062167.1 hypothetical protein [Nannocystis sp. SCPEA4]